MDIGTMAAATPLVGGINTGETKKLGKGISENA